MSTRFSRRGDATPPENGNCATSFFHPPESPLQRDATRRGELNRPTNHAFRNILTRGLRLVARHHYLLSSLPLFAFFFVPVLSAERDFRALNPDTVLGSQVRLECYWKSRSVRGCKASFSVVENFKLSMHSKFYEVNISSRK